MADAPICSAKQNDLLPRAPPSLSSPSVSSDRRPERPLWTFKEAQRVKEPELRIKLEIGFLEGLRRRDALSAPPSGCWEPPVDSVPDDPPRLAHIRWDGEESCTFACPVRENDIFVAFSLSMRS